MDEAMLLRVPVTGIQRFCMHDGPGIRTTVFFKGCPLRCRWCHNPETQSEKRQIFYTAARCIGCGCCAAVCPKGAHRFADGAHIYDRAACTACGRCAGVCPTKALEETGTMMSVGDILAEVMKDAAFYGEDGGLTLSGGEPMAHPRAALALLRAAKQRGINTAVETCGFFDPKLLPGLCESAGTLLWDFKDSDAERHRRNTGAELEPILDNLRRADRLGAKIRLRCIIIQGVNYSGAGCEHVRSIRALRDSLDNCVGVDIIPYHPMGDSKCARLGVPYWGGREYIPDRRDIAELRRMFE